MKRRLTLHVPREAVHQPLTYRLAVDFDVAAKILRAQVAPNQSGTMVVELSGDIDELDAAEAWLERQGLRLDRAPGQIRVDPDRCVDCGICTSLCPSGALSCEAPTWQLRFDAQRCLVCEQCIPSCPFEAISLGLDQPIDGSDPHPAADQP
ncbi:MAG: ferredoxin [Synechococcaceae bacterium WB9_2_112]|jgi:L-aspartate semialdehyde sulfurtransferase ferredoxin|nr:ferredoxin [Synechococcaceae bacterium WB9_2_112]